jgi:hypothetical protein
MNCSKPQTQKRVEPVDLPPALPDNQAMLSAGGGVKRPIRPNF